MLQDDRDRDKIALGYIKTNIRTRLPYRMKVGRLGAQHLSNSTRTRLDSTVLPPSDKSRKCILCHYRCCYLCIQWGLLFVPLFIRYRYLFKVFSTPNFYCGGCFCCTARVMLTISCRTRCRWVYNELK